MSCSLHNKRMSTGLTINSATYGAGSSTVDVTSSVSQKVKDGVLNFTVSTSTFGIDDPAPGQLKTLDLSYTVNGGNSNSISKKENDLVSVRAPPATVASGLQIVKAEYGYPGNWTDVTDALQNLTTSGSINIKVGFKELGLPDPNPNKQKELKVDYTINGSQSSETLKDGEKFKLSAPALEDTSGGKSPTSYVTDILWIILIRGLTFAYVFVQCVSGYVTADFASYLFGASDIVWYSFAFLGAIIPFFAFGTLPMIAFLIRLFKHTDIVPA
jgi:hypothetical protein